MRALTVLTVNKTMIELIAMESVAVEMPARAPVRLFHYYLDKLGVNRVAVFKTVKYAGIRYDRVVAARRLFDKDVARGNGYMYDV